MKKIITIVFVSLIFILRNTSSGFPQGDSKDIVKLYIDTQYQKVIEIVKSKKAEELSANDWYYLGLSYSQIKNIKEAVKAFEHSVKMDSSNTAYRLNYARSLNQYGRTNEAVVNYGNLIENDSTNIAAMYDLGMIYINRKNFTDALPIFQKLSYLNTKDFLSAYYLALSSYQTAVTHEDTVRCNNLIFSAKLLNFEYIPAAELGGIYHLNMNNFEAAHVDYSLLTELNPANAEYYYRAGFCFEKTKNYNVAIGFLKNAIKRDSTITNYYSHLGYNYFMVGEFDSSLTAYSVAALMDPENAASYLNLALVYEKMDSLETAEVYYAKALQFYPYSKIVFNAEKLIAIDYRLKKYEQVQLLCEQVLALAPNSVQSLFYSGCAYDAMGKDNLALEKYKAAAGQLKKDEKYKSEYDYVTGQIEKIKAKVKERKFWEGKINEQ